MKVPFFGNDRQFKSLKEEWMRRADSIWSSGQYLGGKEIESLEGRLASICERKYAVSLSSCADALSISLNYLKVRDALVTNFSFVASASAISNGGGSPVFVPVAAPCFHPTIAAYKEALTSNTNCAVGVSLFGSLANLGDLEVFCNNNKLFLIEDAAQSFGASLNGRRAGSFGFASCLSFDPTKIISGASPAGCLLTDDLGLARYAGAVRNHGKVEGDFLISGRKSLVSSLEASILDLKLDHMSTYVKRRIEIADFYERGLRDVKEILLPKTREGETCTFHKYVIQLEKRNELKQFLSKRGIVSRVHYDKPISHYGVFQSEKVQEDKLSREVCDRVLSLPIFPELSDQEVTYVINSIRKFFDL